jgi:hypothetical protein
MLASVEWTVETTGFGFSVRKRMNVFYDAELGAIARKISEHKALEQAIVNDFHLTV